MTPLHLEILLWYNSRGRDWDCLTALHGDYRGNLVDEGLLDYNKKAETISDASYIITDKGRFWLQSVLELPLPESTFVIPDYTTQQGEE